MQKQIKSFDGTRINYDVSRASGKFLVFLHGAGGDLTAWKKERAFFSRKGFSTIAIDLRGHGKSGRPDLPSDYTIENFAKDIYEVVRKEKIADFVLIGHCFGGVITIMFHKLFPNLAKSYILVDTTYKAPKAIKKFFKNNPFFTDILNRILTNKSLRNKHFSHVNYDQFSGTGDWNLPRIFSDIAHTSLKSWLFTYENLADFNGIKVLKSIDQPTLVIEGEKDSIFNLSKAKKIHNLVRTSELDIIPEANHIIVLNNPKILEKEVLRYVMSLKGFVKKQC
ncbi:alpha/beta hydrolase [Candidatus Woesearchaeota archaeon]|nr:alpha/beta hydrolase [Candidatus Woesearchaeota archaeon]